VKRTSIYITLILALSLGFAPKSFAEGPDYSDQNLPLLKGLKLDVVLDNASQITFKLRVTAETKKNVLSRIDYLQFLPAPNPLEPPCGFTSAKAWKISWILEGNQIKGAGAQEYVLERSFQMQKICAGRYALSDINMQEPSIRFTDSANHWVEYSTSDYAVRQYKSSNVWKSPSAIQPKCELNMGSTEYLRYSLCDENIDLINMIQSNVVNITKEQISFIEAKAAAELKAKQEAEAKSAAELKAKQEAEAKSAAELKAKQEAEAKSAAELKAKQEAEAKSAAELKAKQEAEAKSAAELKAKQEAEAKAAEGKAAGEKIISDAKAEAARILAAAKAAAVKKKITITCIKGKLIKKVTAVKPVCPKGYKKK
jgi:hypothetical protein